MGVKKYKYYFKKPRSAIVKDIFKALLISGGVIVAGNSPYFWLNLYKHFLGLKVDQKRKVRDAFYNLRKQGYIEFKYKGNQLYIYLTKKGKEKAGWLQVDALKIKRPKKWDKKWRIVIFDISQLKKIYREAFRGKLKELGFFPLQKSVWIYPFDCKSEIKVLRKFFGLSENEVRIIIAKDIGEDKTLRKYFRLD